MNVRPEHTTDPPRWADGADGEELQEMLLAARGEAPSQDQQAAMAARLGVPASGALPVLTGKALSITGAVVAGTVGLLWLLSSGSSDGPIASQPAAVEDRVEEHRSKEVSAPAGPSDLPGPGSGAEATGDQTEPGVAEPDSSASLRTSEQAGEPPVAEETRVSSEKDEEPAAGRQTGAAPAKASPRPSEVSLIREARRALGKNPQLALSLTRKHRSLYPGGVLSQEREVIAIEALSELGRDTEAKKKAETFRAEHPDSGHRPAAD